MIAYPGVYRRQVLIRATTGGVSVDFEDDCHRMGVDVAHDGATVTGFGSRMPRIPWATCPGAAASLQQLVGSPLLASPYAVLRQVLLREHCTHLLDMAGLGITAAARGVSHRFYEATISVGRDDGVLIEDATLACDGRTVLRMVTHDGGIIEPPEHAGRELRRAASWSRDIADIDRIEAIFVIARGLLVASGRGPAFDRIDDLTSAVDLPELTGVCFTFSPRPMADAHRQYGSVVDFTDRPQDLLADLRR